MMVEKFASSRRFATMLTFVSFPFIAFGAELPFPVGLYPLNELYNSGDASCYGNLAGKVQGASLVSGPFGNANTAYEFSGFRESYISIPQSQHLDVKNSITILTWVYQTGRAGSIILYWNGGRGVNLRTLSPSAVSVQFTKRGGETVPSLNNSTLDLQNTWHYIGASYDHNTGIATLWSGGKNVQQLNLGQLELKTNGNMVIGGGQGDGDSFEGRVSCVQIYDKVLSEDEVVAVKDRCFEDSLVSVDCRRTSAPSGCGVQLTTLSGTFYSPGFPAGYPNSANCVWEIEVPKEYTIHLKFSRIHLDGSPGERQPDCCDYIIVRDGTSSWSSRLKVLCGGSDHDLDDEISSSGNGMRVEFISDKSGTSKGFTAKYTTAPVSKATDEADPLDFSRHYTGIVIGVACAAIFTILSIITFSHTRRRLLGRNRDCSSRRPVSFDGDDVFQQSAPPTYDDVMRCPELYPPTPCPGSVVSTPVVTPRWGSPTSSPALSRHSASLQRPGIVIPKTGTPVGMPIFAPRRAMSNRSIPGSSPGMSLQRGISPLARADLTPQHSRHADHQSSGEDEEDPPPYPGIAEDTSGGTYMPRNVDSVLDQVREALESQRHSEAEDNDNVSDSDSRIASANILSDSISSSAVAGNTGLRSDASFEVANNPTSSGPGSGHGAQSNNSDNPRVRHEEPPRENRVQATMSSIESVV